MTDPQLWALSVWPTGQTSHRAQRRGRYLPESAAHPARMLPAIARQTISTYTQPGDLILDPMCGIGTTLVEAVHLGRDAIGVELQPRWARLARRNLTHAQLRGASGTARVITGDAGQLTSLDPRLDRPVSLVLTSPPYGMFAHGQVATLTGHRGMNRWDHRYATTAHPADLARLRQDRFLAALTEMLTTCTVPLRPGGVVVLTARPWRRDTRLTDLPGLLIHAAGSAGLMLVDRVAALLARLDDGRVVPHASFFQLANVRAARQRGLPVSVIAHEDLLVFQAGRRGGRD